MLRSGAASISAPVNAFVTLNAKNTDDYDLLSDSPQAVAFGGVAVANIVIINSDRKIMLTLTSADGAAQTIPCDGEVYLISRTVGFTAISLTRIPATETHVKVFLGEKA